MKVPVPNALSKVVGRTGLVLQKHSPEILLGVGILGVVGSTVLACRATLKCEATLNKAKKKIETINKCWNDVETGKIPKDAYTKEDRTKDLTVAYIQTGADFVKLYGPAIALGAVSIGCLVGSHRILSKRNMALVAAYKTIEEGFNAYRKRVREEHGDNTDYAYKNGLKSEEIVEKEIGEDGKTIKVKKTRYKPYGDPDDPNTHSVYARFFDESCKEWTKTPEYNLMYLRSQQNYFNQMLQARGHVFLNEVYDALGISRSQAGSVVGWVLGKGDNYIDFGIFDGASGPARAFVNGEERSILLDFNVDGVIYDLI